MADGAVGKRIRVFWSGDNRWFSGTVTQTHSRHRGYQVAYDDGDVKFENLDDDALSWERLDETPRFTMKKRPESGPHAVEKLRNMEPPPKRASVI